MATKRVAEAALAVAWIDGRARMRSRLLNLFGDQSAMGLERAQCSLQDGEGRFRVAKVGASLGPQSFDYRPLASDEYSRLGDVLIGLDQMPLFLLNARYVHGHSMAVAGPFNQCLKDANGYTVRACYRLAAPKAINLHCRSVWTSSGGRLPGTFRLIPGFDLQWFASCKGPHMATPVDNVVTTIDEKHAEAVESVRQVSDNLAHAIDRSVAQRPYTTLIMALGFGFVLGALWAR
jgi:hypothetical protein